MARLALNLGSDFGDEALGHLSRQGSGKVAAIFSKSCFVELSLVTAPPMHIPDDDCSVRDSGFGAIRNESILLNT